MQKFITGTCEEMCPTSELQMRCREKLLHYYEQKSKDPKMVIVAVKEFQRSAAGVKAPKSADLRTVGALTRTIEYLILEIFPDDKKPYPFIYDFIFDRFRAIRQEIVMQNLDPATTVALLSPIAMFLSFSLYELCEEPIANFDKKICNQHLQECLKKILYSYDELDRVNIPYDLAKRIYLEALYTVFNLGSTEAINRNLKLSKAIRNTNYVKISMKMSIEYQKGNFYRMLLLMKHLPNILSCVASIKLQDIRRKILQQFSIAYQSKVLTVPLKWLSVILCCDDMILLSNDCIYYGLEINKENTGVKFDKTKFDMEKALLSSKHEEFVDKKILGVNLSQLILLRDISLLN